MDQEKINEFRDGIFALKTRRFGTVAEIMIKSLYNLDESGSLAFDKKTKGTNERIEIKFSTALKKNKEKIRDNNVINQCLKANLANRKMNSYETCAFDSNIQQVKRTEFDVLYYGLFFNDQIEIFMIRSEDIKKENLRYSDKQHRGNKGEGQFHLNNKNLEEHRKKYLQHTLTYAELYDLFQKIETQTSQQSKKLKKSKKSKK